MGVIVHNALPNIEIRSLGGCLTEVKIDGELVRCRSYTLEQDAGGVPVITIELQPFITSISLNGIVEIGNKDEIAKLMSRCEFEDFCDTWRSIHRREELLE